MWLLCYYTPPKRGYGRKTLEKINIYVPENIGAMIESDATMFEVYKKDGRTINKNRFLGMLIIGYYNDYVTEAKAAYDAILSAIDTNKVSIRDKERIADSILKNVVLPTVLYGKEKILQSYLWNQQRIQRLWFNRILLDLGGSDYISQYFCKNVYELLWKAVQQKGTDNFQR